MAAVLGRLQPLRVRRAVAPDADGWVEATFRLGSLDGAVADLLSLGAEVEVLDPDALRDRVAALARAHRSALRLSRLHRPILTPRKVRIPDSSDGISGGG